MTNPNLSYIATVLDRSGSMAGLQSAVISGYNEFLEAQRKEPGKCLATLVQFDHEYDMVYRARPLRDAPNINMETYVPRGTTALLDAIGRTIDSVGSDLHLMLEPERPSKVIFVVYTDGFENASKDYDLERIHRMITVQRERYNWAFLFLGANQDAIRAGMKMGFKEGQSMTYAHNDAGYRGATQSTSGVVGAMRATAGGQHVNAVGFSDADRAAANPQPDTTGANT